MVHFRTTNFYHVTKIVAEQKSRKVKDIFLMMVVYMKQKSKMNRR
ncbi:hypothetical protein [Bacillus cereus]|nr:hypothetical protein [Bacillus cereus]